LRDAGFIFIFVSLVVVDVPKDGTHEPGDEDGPVPPNTGAQRMERAGVDRGGATGRTRPD